MWTGLGLGTVWNCKEEKKKGEVQYLYIVMGNRMTAQRVGWPMGTGSVRYRRVDCSSTPCVS